jgi:UDP-2-acetamido-2,6-beta-L-arabino-hexul-4-ose reductase
MRIVVTGGDGFIGKNLRLALREAGYTDITPVTRATSETDLTAALASCEFVFHLAGVNRPQDPKEFEDVNQGFTSVLCHRLRESGRPVPLVFASSIQAALDNPYGRSKRAGEEAVERYGQETGARAIVLRLSNVFGKWCRPNYNSAVATFCYNLVHGKPITVNDPAATVRLVYIDDVVRTMIGLLPDGGPAGIGVEAGPVYATTVGEVVEILRSFEQSRRNLQIGPVGTGLTRALFATYLSYLPPEEFGYDLTRHADPRGVFVEMLKTRDSGQFSYFTAGPGITRGGHYHHTKTERFLVLHGTARFGFRHVLTDERHDLVVEGTKPHVVETVPGWVHDITNVGSEELIVMLWANEIFDPEHPDTIAAKVAP